MGLLAEPYAVSMVTSSVITNLEADLQLEKMALLLVCCIYLHVSQGSTFTL
jgi:hypothetical protein